MNKVLTVSFDNSSNEDIPTMIVSVESFGIFGNRTEVINTITGDRATELYNELARPKKACVKAGGVE